MSMIKKYIYRMIWVLCTLCALPGCHDDLKDPVVSHPKGMVVSFTAQYAANNPVSRATGGKTAFENDDVIHIGAKFYEEQPGEAKNATLMETQYCAYKYQNGDWIPLMKNNEITWPYECDYGLFTAYYIKHADGAVSGEEGESAIWSLSEFADKEKPDGISDDTGPMKAESQKLPFGHTVHLTFSHLCARLSVTKLEASTTSEYWFTHPAHSDFHNAYQLVRDQEEGIKLQWVSQSSGSDNPYIARSLDSNAKQEYGNTVTVYLEPGDYSGAKLNYKYNRSYITLSSGSLDKLKANHSYVLDITQDKGIVFENPDEGGWTDPDNKNNAWKLQNIPAFLMAASKGEAYEEEKKQILERTNMGVILLTDLDFDKQDPLSTTQFPDSYLSQLPDLLSSVTFDGNYHYIHHSVRPIFNEIQGRLYNLGISNMERTGEVHPGTDQYGGLSRIVSQTGIISNVRISHLTLTLSLPYTDKVDVYNIGCVTGRNDGKISDVALRGTIQLSIQDSDESQGTKSEIYIGGIIGQNAGTLSGCTTFKEADDNTPTHITVKNKCKNQLPVSTGGIVGFSFNNVEDVTLRVTVDASQSTGNQNYTGGMAGRVRRSDGVTEKNHFKNISIQGSVKGGKGTEKSFTGGIAGRLYNFLIENCNALCDVESWNETIDTGARYATGGAFGCIVTTTNEPTLIFNSSWWGDKLTGASTISGNCYLGTFAGIIPTHKTDGEYQNNGNITKNIDDVPFSGGNLDDENTSKGR